MRWMPVARAFCGEPGERDLHLARRGHHEVGELVDDHHDVRAASAGASSRRAPRPGRRAAARSGPRTRGCAWTGSSRRSAAVGASDPGALGRGAARRPRPRSRRRRRPRPRASSAAAASSSSSKVRALGAELLDLAVVALEVLRAGVGEDLRAPLHLVDRPLERARGLLRVGHDRQEQVRDVLVGRQLGHLRVDHDHPHLGRRLPVEHASRIMVLSPTDLPEPVVPGDEQVRHPLQVDAVGEPLDVLAEAERQEARPRRRRPQTRGCRAGRRCRGRGSAPRCPPRPCPGSAR